MNTTNEAGVKPATDGTLNVAGRYFGLTDAQKLALTADDLRLAIKLEAVQRGIKPPITLEAHIRQSENIGFTTPPDAMVFHEIMVPTSYNVEGSGVCFQTAEEAWAAMRGAFAVYSDGYGATQRMKLADSAKYCVRQIHVGGATPKSYHTKLEEFFQDDAEFDKLSDECVSDLSAIRQREYDLKVTQQKRKEYLELAKGNLEIARAFWSRAERTAFPEMEASA